MIRLELYRRLHGLSSLKVLDGGRRTPSSRGPGLQPFTLRTGVRIPLGSLPGITAEYWELPLASLRATYRVAP